MVDCAKCGRKFFQHSPVNALWCDKDRFFLCRKCTAPTAPKQPRLCPFCTSRVSSALSAVFALAVFGLGMCLLFGSLLYLDVQARTALQDTPEVQVGAVHAGEFVRLYGTISSLQNPVLSAYWHSNPKGGGYWVWSGHDFTLNQGNASIWVDVSGMLGSIYGNPPHSTQSNAWYESTDSIAVVGTVGGSGSTLTIHAIAAGSSPDAFVNGTEFPVVIGFYGAAVISGGGAVYLYIKAVARAKDHVSRTRQPGMYDYRLPSGADDPS